MSRPARKRQQRLTFTPIPSSSPAAKGYHKQIRDRAAAVSLEGSPGSSKRGPRETVPDDLVDLVSDDEVPIPTPAASLELASNADRRNDQGSDSDSEPIRSTQRPSGRTKRPRQQRLDFSNTRDPASFDSPVRLPSYTRTRSPKTGGMFSSQAQGRIEQYSDDGSEQGSQELPSPRKMLKARKSAENATRRSKGKAGKKRNTRSSPVAIEEESEGEEIIVAGSRKQSPPKAVEDSGDDTDMPTTQRRRRGQPRASGSAQSSPTPVVVEDEDEDDEDTDMPTTQGKQSRKVKRKRRSSFINDSPPPAPDSDDDVIILPPRKRARENSESEDVQSGDGDEEEDPLPKTPGRRGLKKRQKQLSQREQEDLEEDLDFLAPSDDDASSSGRQPRNTQSAQKSAKQQALERLKRARAGQSDQVEDQEDEDAGQTGSEEEDDDVAEPDDVPFTSSRRFFQEQDDDADFVEEEDDEGPLGVPAGIPLEFTRYASLKPKELFKYAVDWMLQKRLNPAFQRQDPLYELAFRKLNDEAKGLAGSKFTSSAWTQKFKYALEARPQIEILELDAIEMEDHDKCDACNRSSHQCTYKIRFHGNPYHNDTLENIGGDDEDSDDDSDASSSQASNESNYNASGMSIVGADHIFFVGKFCKSNAATSHALQHWRYHLNEYVQSYLRTAGYFQAKELEKRSGWSIKKLSKYANKVLQGMERDGEVTSLWKLFRANIDEARESKGGRFRGYTP